MHDQAVKHGGAARVPANGRQKSCGAQIAHQPARLHPPLKRTRLAGCPRDQLSIAPTMWREGAVETTAGAHRTTTSTRARTAELRRKMRENHEKRNLAFRRKRV